VSQAIWSVFTVLECFEVLFCPDRCLKILPGDTELKVRPINACSLCAGTTKDNMRDLFHPAHTRSRARVRRFAGSHYNYVGHLIGRTQSSTASSTERYVALSDRQPTTSADEHVGSTLMLNAAPGRSPRTANVQVAKLRPGVPPLF
jgi:hypothetical protein